MNRCTLPIVQETLTVSALREEKEIYIARDSFIHQCLYNLLLGPCLFFSFVIIFTQTSDQPVARPLPKHRTTRTRSKRTQTSMPRVGFEIHDPSVRANEDSSCLRRRGHCDRHRMRYLLIILDKIRVEVLNEANCTKHNEIYVSSTSVHCVYIPRGDTKTMFHVFF
jgi:hypothetical protein